MNEIGKMNIIYLRSIIVSIREIESVISINKRCVRTVFTGIILNLAVKFSFDEDEYNAKARSSEFRSTNTIP